MPNLEYSVKFVLASDSTTEIDQALAKMRDTGSTITIKVNADASGFDSEMKKVNAEIQKAEASNEKLSRSAQKGSGLFKMYAKDIREALNQFRATGNLEKAQESFAGISAKVEDFGASMKDSARGMQEFYTLTNQITSATATLNREQNNSAGVIKANEAVQRALNEETKKSAQILATRARASAFDARQTKQSAQEVRDNVAGQIALLRRLSVQGRGTAEEIAIAFNRTANTTEELQVTTDDLTQAFVRQQKAVEGSRMSFKNKQQTINQLKVAEEQTAQSMRKTTAGLGQQENQVGDVSYAMVSFTRLLEDMPYGFRGFANNIQPTVYGLIQLNDKTNAAALAFREMHGKEMPLAQRAMINFKSALSSPINQLLLLTSVVAVAGTMLERWAQSSKKAGEGARSLTEDFLKLYDVTKMENPLETDYEKSIMGLERYAQALQSVVDNEERVEMARFRSAQEGMDGIAGQTMVLLNRMKGFKIESDRLKISQSLSAEAKKKLDTLVSEQRTLNEILSLEGVRMSIQRQFNEERATEAIKNTANLEEQIRIERVRQTQGEEASIRLRYALMGNKILEDQTLTIMEAGILLRDNAKNQELELLRVRNRSSATVKEIRNEYDGILMSLQRQLEDEGRMTTLEASRIARARELADLTRTIIERRLAGEDISDEQEKKLYNAVEARYDLIDQRQANASRLVVKDLATQAMLSEKLVRVEQELLFGDEARGVVLDLQIQAMENEVALAERIRDINEDMTLDEEQRLDAIRSVTREMQNQFRITLMRQQAEARRIVQQFLGSKDSDEARIEQSAYEARLANAEDFAIEKQKIDQNDFASRFRNLQAITALTARQAKTSVDITKEEEKQKNAIRRMGYVEGAMIITSALSQLNDSTEANGRRAFERQKAFAIGLGTINTLLAFTQVLADEKLGTFMKWAQASAVLIAGFAQVNQIRNTKYGGGGRGASTGNQAPSRQSYGFTEVDTRQASAGVGGTMNAMRPINNITVVGNVDREGIAFAVRDGEDIISSRALF